MPSDPRWDTLSDSDWDRFAACWIAQLQAGDDYDGPDYYDSVVFMNFTSTPEQQWLFIEASMRHATPNEYGHIAAGPIEHLLGFHGEQTIELVERRALADPGFRDMLSTVRKHLMSDEVWDRLKASRLQQ